MGEEIIKFIKEYGIGVLFWILIIAGASGLFSENSEKSDFQSSSSSYMDNDYITNHDEAVAEYKEKPDGTYTVEACNQSTGSCYDLDADISDGTVERIYFSNGGHLDIDGAELDEEGYASGESYTVDDGYNGDSWEINCSDCE
ncbi:hypothetical protein KKD57_03225 [Patescibacteria group bacterium]|nr:hypothetical protein [Patescibacteria group bacterium]